MEPPYDSPDYNSEGQKRDGKDLKIAILAVTILVVVLGGTMTYFFIRMSGSTVGSTPNPTPTSGNLVTIYYLLTTSPTLNVSAFFGPLNRNVTPSPGGTWLLANLTVHLQGYSEFPVISLIFSYFDVNVNGGSYRAQVVQNTPSSVTFCSFNKLGQYDLCIERNSLNSSVPFLFDVPQGFDVNTVSFRYTWSDQHGFNYNIGWVFQGWKT